MTRTRRKHRRRLNPRFIVLCLTVGLLAAGGGLWWLNRGLPGEDVELPDWVQEELIPVNEWSRPALPLKQINGVVIHYVGNPGTTAQANRNYFASLANGEEKTYASSHFVVGLEGEVVQCIPLTEIAYATGPRNQDTIAIEVCHPDSGGEFSEVTYDRMVELTAFLCRTFDLDPGTEVIRHYDVTEKICPKYYVEHPEAWEALRADVCAALETMKKEERNQ